MKNVTLVIVLLLTMSTPTRVQSVVAGTWRAEGFAWTIELLVDGATVTGTVDQDGDGVDPAVLTGGRGA